MCKDISTQAEIQKWYYSERVIVPCVQGYQYTILCPVCKAEIEDEENGLFSCKACDDFRKRRVVV